MKIGLVLLCIAGLLGFAALALSYRHDPFASMDRDVARWVADDLPSSVQDLARPFSWIGGWIGVTALSVVATVVLARGRAWLDLALFLTALIGSQLVVALLKNAFERPRPDVGSAVPLPHSASFPSGHATTGIAVFGAATVLLSERMANRHARVWLWTGAVVLGLGIGVSRIALDVHYVTDVLAGWCLGLAWLAGCLLVRDALRARALSPQ